MTCIVGIEDGDVCWIAGDSVVSYDDTRVVSREGKVRRVGGYVLGVCGGLREHNLAMTWRAPTWDETHPWRWTVEEYVPQWLAALRTVGLLEPDCWQLLGVGGELLSIGCSGSVHTWADGYAAIGSGADVALGALDASQQYQPRTRLKKALEAAARRDPTRIGPPWRTVRG